MQGPFTTFKLQQDRDCDWTSLKFSNDGKMILISTNGAVIRLVDAFSGQPMQTFMVIHRIISQVSKPPLFIGLLFMDDLSWKNTFRFNMWRTPSPSFAILPNYF